MPPPKAQRPKGQPSSPPPEPVTPDPIPSPDPTPPEPPGALSPVVPPDPLAPEIPEPSSVEHFNEPFAELDKLVAAAQPSPAEPPEPTPPPEPEPQPSPPIPNTPKELRQAYDASKLKIKELEDQLDVMRRVKPDDPEKKTLSEELARMREQNQALHNELKFAAFERSEDYKSQYEKPYVDAWTQARTRAGQLRIKDDESGETRSARPEDFDSIVAIPDDSDAQDQAEQVFGKHANIVMMHREKIRDLYARKVAAVEEHRKTMESREREANERQEADRQAMSKVWNAGHEEAKARYPEIFVVSDGDEKKQQILDKSFALVDMAFSPPANMPRTELVRLSAAVRNRAAAFSYLMYLNNEKKARISELEAELQKYRNTSPPAGLPGTPPSKGELDWEKDLESRSGR